MCLVTALLIEKMEAVPEVRVPAKREGKSFGRMGQGSAVP